MAAQSPSLRRDLRGRGRGAGPAAFLTLLSLAVPVEAATSGDVARALVARMSLPEKIAQLQSAAPAIARLGVPAYAWWSEGLHGLARDGVATVFPQAIGLAATWDSGLMTRVGDTVATEARAKFNALGPRADHARYQGLTIWSPNINILRDPRWGRGQETYGEDPYLTGRLAVGFIAGLQGPDPAHPKVIATAKHFAVHSGPEGGRHGFDVDVSPHDMEATYTPAFRAAVTQGGVQSVMCAYNALHGTPSCADAGLLDARLRRAWGFRGAVVSDCDAVDDMTRFHFFRADAAAASAAALVAGTDLDCGSAYASLGLAAKRGDVASVAITRAVTRLFEARARLGILPGSESPYSTIGADAVDTPTSRALALAAARETIVLLKNAGARLPLATTRRIAVIGPAADALEDLEANYHGVASAPVTPLQGLRAIWGAERVSYAQGSAVAPGVPGTIPESALRVSAEAGAAVGLRGAYFDALDLSGAPRVVRDDRLVAFDWDEAPPAPGVDPHRYAVRWTGALIPPAAGDYTLVANVARCFDCAGHDQARLWVDGRLAFEDAGDGLHAQATLRFQDTQPHAIRLELVHTGQDQGVRLQWIAPLEAQLDEARAATKSADVVVAFVGLSPDVEGEDLRVVVPGFDGGDRTSIELPAPQQRLLEVAAEAGKPIVVVLMSGGAIGATWAEAHAAAVLWAGYPGQAGGRAIAETLSGANDPAGRLPMTMYRSTKDLPAFTDYRMAGRTYRGFAGAPLYAFGHGLSYTRFAYDGLTLSAATLAAGRALTLHARVRNVGARAGDEVAQVYLTPPQTPDAPRRSLVGFERVRLAPGEARDLVFTIAPRDLSNVDAAGRRAVEPGRYGLFVGGGQPGDAPGVSATLTMAGRVELER